MSVGKLFQQAQRMLDQDRLDLLSVHLIDFQVIRIFYQVIHKATKVQQRQQNRFVYFLCLLLDCSRILDVKFLIVQVLLN